MLSGTVNLSQDYILKGLTGITGSAVSGQVPYDPV